MGVSIALFVMIICCGIANAGPTHITVKGYVASTSQDLFARTSGYMASGDTDAARQMLRMSTVILLRGGIPVYVVKYARMGSRVLIRPEGTAVEVWTNCEAIKRK